MNRIPNIFDTFLTEWPFEYLSKIPGDQEPAHYFFDKEANEYVITVPAPGYLKEDIDIEVVEKGLAIKGELKDEKLKERLGERIFSYILERPGIKSKNITASLENGILEIRVKKEEVKKQKIAIN